MNQLVFESNEVSIPMLEIKTRDEMEGLVTILTTNGYEVQVSPVYETLEKREKRGLRTYEHTVPIVDYWVVKIIGTIAKPVYKV